MKIIRPRFVMSNLVALGLMAIAWESVCEKILDHGAHLLNCGARLAPRS